MKKLILLFAVIAHFGYSQNSENRLLNYELDLQTYNGDQINVNSPKILMNWNFSKLDTNKSEVIIEIVPILDCYNKFEASNMLETIRISSKSEGFKSDDSIVLDHIQMESKCFKYRVVIQSSVTTQEISDWKFYSFIK